MTNENPSSQDPAPVESPAEPSSIPPANPATGEPARTRKRWIAAAAAALGVALFAVPLLRGPHDRPSPPSRSEGAPVVGRASGPSCEAKASAHLDFTLKDIDGASVKLTDYKGKVVLLNFWATWCGPCEQEIPAFVEMYDRYKDKGFVILGVSIDDPPEALRAYAKSHRMQYPVLQMQSDVEDAYGPIFGVPMSYFIARDGSICKRHLGPATREQVERELKALL